MVDAKIAAGLRHLEDKIASAIAALADEAGGACGRIQGELNKLAAEVAEQKRLRAEQAIERAVDDGAVIELPTAFMRRRDHAA